MVRPAPEELGAFLAPFPEDVVETVLRLRDRVLGTIPNAHEIVWDATNAVSLVFAPATRWQDGICHIATYTKHVNLGFNQGALLDDPDGIFEGTGRLIRHVRVRSVDAADAEWIERYLDAALAEARLDRTMGDGGTTIRVSQGPKRRTGP